MSQTSGLFEHTTADDGLTSPPPLPVLLLQVEVLRGGRFSVVPSTALVPGDVVAVTTGVLPADCVLLTGECIVDENMLTGKVLGRTGTVSTSCLVFLAIKLGTDAFLGRCLHARTVTLSGHTLQMHAAPA
jgi:hypothetical protein